MLCKKKHIQLFMFMYIDKMDRPLNQDSILFDCIQNTCSYIIIFVVQQLRNKKTTPSWFFF